MQNQKALEKLAKKSKETKRSRSSRSSSSADFKLDSKLTLNDKFVVMDGEKVSVLEIYDFMRDQEINEFKINYGDLTDAVRNSNDSVMTRLAHELKKTIHFQEAYRDNSKDADLKEVSQRSNRDLTQFLVRANNHKLRDVSDLQVSQSDKDQLLIVKRREFKHKCGSENCVCEQFSEKFRE